MKRSGVGWGLLGAILLFSLAVSIWSRASRREAAETKVFAKGVSDVPFGSTRGHFIDGELQTGHDRFDYAVEGAVPGLKAAPAKDIVIVVHGLNNDEIKAENRFALARESLKHNGYQGVVIGWSWDGASHDPFGATGYSDSKANAIANGPKLGRFLVDLALANPGAKVRLLGYSMGARVAVEGILAVFADPILRQQGLGGWRAASVHLLGAAIDNEELHVDEKYGRAIQKHVGFLYNYYSPSDAKLGLFFPLRDRDRALGRDDIEDPDLSPNNYRSRNVAKELMDVDDRGMPNPKGPRGKNHSAYLGLRDNEGVWRDDGAMNVVAEDIAGS